jgi:uncharacterized membrane protein YbhN (UPF0104 family)
VTTLPGGIGAYGAGLIGLLVAVGIDPADAGAITILFTVADRGVGTLLGIGPYFLFQRRFGHVPSESPPTVA